MAEPTPEPTPTPAEVPAPAAAPPVAPAPDQPWYGEIADVDLAAWVKTKNPPNAEAMAKSYHNLEQMFGADKAGRTVVIPNADSTVEDKSIFYNKLGRPEKSENYELDLPDNANKEFVDWFRNQSHTEGLSQAQVKNLFNSYNEFQGTHAKAELDTQTAQGKLDHDNLVTEWGPAYNDKVQMGKVAASQFGFTPEHIDALQKTSSYSAIMKNFAEIGKALGEAGLVNAGTTPGFSGSTLSPAEAQSQINDLKSQKEWVKKFVAGDVSATETMHRLQEQVGK